MNTKFSSTLQRDTQTGRNTHRKQKDDDQRTDSALKNPTPSPHHQVLIPFHTGVLRFRLSVERNEGRPRGRCALIPRGRILHRRLLPCPVCAFIIGEDSFVITCRQFGIHSCLQCAFQCLVHGPFLEIIMLFSSCSKDSLYPVSRSRATMELSPHPNDIRVRSLHMSVP